MALDKIKTFVGFAVKSRKIIYGLDDILKSKQVQIIIYSNNLAENSKNKIQKFAIEKNIFTKCISSDDIFEILQNNNIKAFALTDKNLANAIKMNFTNDVSNGGNLE